MPRRGRAQTAYFFEKLPFSETDHDPNSMNTLSDTPAPVLWPGNKDEDPSLHPYFYNLADAIELMQRSRRARHPLTRREPVHIHELHPILYPGADLERYLSTVRLLCERLKQGSERDALLSEACTDLNAYLKHHHSEIPKYKQENIIQSLQSEFEKLPWRVFKRERDSSPAEVEDEELEIYQNIIQMTTELVDKQNALREECNRLGQDPRVYVWRRDAWLLGQRWIFDICEPEFLWIRRSSFKRSMGDTYRLRIEPNGYANGYANYMQIIK